MTTEAQTTTETTIKFIPTFEKVEVSDYPYGFRLRTTLYDTIEFDKKKGYRHVTQTINPKNNRLNNPKKSTYSALMVRYYEAETNHIKCLQFDFNGDKQINRGLKFLNQNFDLFTKDEKYYLYLLILSMTALDLKATVIYGGSKLEDLKPFYDDAIRILKQGVNDPENNYFNFLLDVEGIENTKPKNHNPFVTTKEVNIMDL